MKKQLIKEILEIDKLLKHEIKVKEKANKEIQKVINKIHIIEEKIKNINKKSQEKKKILNFSYLEKLYSIATKKNKEKIIIENNLPEFRKQNEQKQIQLEKQIQKLNEKSIKNEEKIANKKEELINLYEKFKEKSGNFEEKEQIIISPDIMSIYLESKTTKEIEFMNKIRNQTKKIKINNEKILKQIDSYLKNVTNLKSKKESSSNAELSTGVKNSSYFSRKNFPSQKFDFLNSTNLNNYNEENDNEENDSTSSISMELETNLNLDQLPSDDESLRFIDKVFDIKSNIKPIRNDLKSVIYPILMPKSKEKIVKVEPIKIEKPIDYKNKNEEILKDIEIIEKEINGKKIKIEEIKNKKNIIKKKDNKIESDLQNALIKITIIKEQIDCIKKQIEDYNKGQYFRKLSINNIINNRNYCIFDNNENNSIYDKETFRK